MPRSPPAEPPEKAMPIRTASGIRHRLCTAFHLSAPYIINVIRLMAQIQIHKMPEGVHPEKCSDFDDPDSGSIRKPGLVKPQRTFNNEIAYIGNNSGGEFNEISVGKATVSLRLSQKDELVIINSSNFFVCENCGYADLDQKRFTPVKVKKHKNPSGYECKGQLKRYSLGYRFQTDVVQIRFLSPTLSAAEWSVAYSVLQGVLHGFTSKYSIDERDVSGCLHYYFDENYGSGYSLILYDNTPGG